MNVRHARRACPALPTALLLACAAAWGAERGGPRGEFRTDVPPQAFTLLLGRPTRASVTVRVLAAAEAVGHVRYGRDGGPCTNRTPDVRFAAGTPADVLLNGLEGDTRYRYELRARPDTGAVAVVCAQGSFRTQRDAGRAFTFTVTADSHLDENTDPALYAATLRLALTDHPDFHVDLGDTFMTDKRGGRPEAARPQYLAQTYYLGLLAREAPLFLVLGNHDGEFGGRMEEAARMRTAYFPNPVADGFYTGSSSGNYYAWSWADVLSVVLDPFRYSERPRGGEGADNWALTLGRAQYDWLRTTLAESHARYKFVFIHNLVGGLDRQGRGGAEAVPFFEWGGHDPDGRDAFAAKRPGWPKPIHALLVEHGVTAVFHGHDHFFAKQEADGIVYQLVPQPGHPGEGSIGQAAAYGYRSGELRPGAGYLRVLVGPAEATVAYVCTSADAARADAARGRVAFRYALGGRR